MSMSGVVASGNVTEIFEKFKMVGGHKPPVYDYLCFAIDKKEWIVETAQPYGTEASTNGGTEMSLAELVKKMPKTSCRFYAFPLKWKQADGDRSTILLISWVSNNSPVKERMMYASSAETLKKACTGAVYIDANDYDESEISKDIITKVSKGKAIDI